MMVARVESMMMMMILNPYRRNIYDQASLRPLKTYAYAGVDKSLLSQYVLRHYWNWVTANLVPIWIAPNLITLLGTLCMFCSYCLAIFFSPDFVDSVPRVLYFVFAVLLWAYSTLDNVDGKQARRTQSSSPLGELFDHGCDSLVIGMGLIIQLAALEVGRSKYVWCCTALAFWSFFLPTWEEYHTGVLYLGIINGPCEGIVACCLSYLLTGIFGPQIWTTTIYHSNWNVADLTLLTYAIGFLLYIAPSSIVNVYDSCKKKEQSFDSAIRTLIPFVVVSLSVASLAYNCKLSGALSLFLSLLTVLFGRMCGDVICSHLLKLPFPSLPFIVWPLLASSIAAVVLRSDDWVKPFLTIYFVISIVEYADWVSRTVNSFTTYLGIQCFVLNRPNNQPVVASSSHAALSPPPPPSSASSSSHKPENKVGNIERPAPLVQ